MLVNISGAPLKPSQKVELLRMFSLPRLIYQADHALVGPALLSECDRRVRATVKRWLHLVPFTTDGVLYSRHKDGGLALPRLESLEIIIEIICLKSFSRDSECIIAQKQHW